MLSQTDKRALSFRLGIDLSGGALLCVGLLYEWMFPEQSQVASLIEAFAALLVGASTLYRGFFSILRSNLHHSTDQLVSLAILASALRGDFFTAVLLPLVLDLVRVFEERAFLGVQASIDQLLALSEGDIYRVNSDKEEVCTLDDLKLQEIIHIYPGMQIPVDGLVLDGWSLVDQSALTGESRAEEVQAGSSVLAGSHNISGKLRVQVVAKGKEAAIGRVITQLEEVVYAPALPVVEKWIALYVPLLLCICATHLFFFRDIESSIAILIALCPVALAISGPSVMVCALSAAAKKGVLIKRGVALTMLPDCDIVAVDKTGTLTTGTLELQSFSGEDEDFLWAASCANISLHPVSRALVQEAKVRGWTLRELQGTEEQGKGIRAHLGEDVYFLGRKSWLEEQGIDVPQQEGTVFFAKKGGVACAFVLTDVIREEARLCLDSLKEHDTRRIMLTGDRDTEAHRVAQVLGIEEVYAQLLPEEKAQKIKELEGSVVMVGDGINDALALREAKVGVAIGASLSEAALGGADIAIKGQDLNIFLSLISLGERTRNTLFLCVLISVFCGTLLGMTGGIGWLTLFEVAFSQIFVVLLVSIIASTLLREDTKNR